MPLFLALIYRTTVRHKGIRCDCVASLLVPFFVSFCGSFCYAASRLPSCSSSRFPSRLVSCRRAVSFVSARRAERSLRGVLRRLAISSSLVRRSYLVSCRRPASRLVLRCVGRDGLAFLFNVVGRRVSICRLGSLLTQFAFVSFPFVVVSVGRFWAWVCGEIELTKTARLAACRLRLISGSCVRES